jgi:hypothetical protein
VIGDFHNFETLLHISNFEATASVEWSTVEKTGQYGMLATWLLPVACVDSLECVRGAKDKGRILWKVLEQITLSSMVLKN